MRRAAQRVRDEQGWEFGDLVAASRMAIDAIRAIISEDALSGVIDLNGYVEVTDERGNLLVTIPFCDAVSLLGELRPARSH